MTCFQKMVNRCSSLVVGKQVRQTIAVTPYLFLLLFMVMEALQCLSVCFRKLRQPSRCFAVCHAACSSSAFVTAAPMSYTTLRSFLPCSTSFHHAHIFQLLQGRAYPSLTLIPLGMHLTFP